MNMQFWILMTSFIPKRVPDFKIIKGLQVSFRLGIKSRLGQEIVWSFALKAINTGLMFLTTVFLARLLGVTGYGIYSYAYSLITLLSLPAHAGLPDLILRETAKGLAQERYDLVRGAWQWAGRVVAILSVIVVGVGGPLLIAWQGGLRETAGQTMAWALLLVPLIALGNLRGAALRGLQRVVLGQLPESALRPGLFFLFIGSMAILREEMLSPPIAMMLHVIASFLAFVIGAWLLWRYTPGTIRCIRPSIDTHGWLLSSLVFALLASFSVVNQQASTVILGLFATPGDVGSYRVATQVATVAAFGLNSINMVTAPRFADLWVRQEKVRLQQLVTRSAQMMLMVSLLVTTAFLLAGQPFFHLVFGPEFDGCYIPLLILLLGYVVDSALGPAGMLLNMTGHETDTAVIMAWVSVLNIALNVVLIPIMGVAGAAMAVAVSMATWKVLFWWRALKWLKINSSALFLKL